RHAARAPFQKLVQPRNRRQGCVMSSRLPFRDLPASARKVTQRGSTLYVIAAKPRRLRALYHSFLRWRWSASLGVIGAGFVVVNLVFATLYYLVGGVAG